MNTTPEDELNVHIQEEEFKEEFEVKQGRLYPTFTDLAAIFGVFIVSQLGAVFASMLIVKLFSEPLTTDLRMAWTMLIAQIISMAITVIFISFLRRRRGAEPPVLRLSIKGFNPTVLLGGLLMIVSMSVVLEPILSLLPSVPDVEGRGWPMLVALVLVAPIFEEIICRGMIYESLRLKSGIVVACLVSSLFFGLMHLHPAMIVNAFFMGLILCYIYIRSRSLIASMILHALNNALAYILILLDMGENVMLKDLITNQNIYYVVYAVAVLVLIISIVICSRQFKKIVAQQEGVDSQEEDNF